MKILLLDKFDNFLQWWADGLAQIVPTSWGSRHKQLKQHLLLHYNEKELLIEHFAQVADEATTRHLISTYDESDKKNVQEWLAKSPELSTLPTILRLQSDRILVKRLRYPAAARADLRNVISYDINRQTPFSREDVYFDFEEIATKDASAHIEVDLFLIPKKELEPLESTIKALELRLTAIDISGPTSVSGVNLLPIQSEKKCNQPPYRIWFGLFILWLSLITLIPVKLILDSNATIIHLEQQQKNGITTIQPLKELRDRYAKHVNKSKFLNHLRSKHIGALDLLGEITNLLSDNTWIRRFEFKNGTLRLQGESTNASEILGILDGSPRFSSPTFSSPVTRNNSNGSDRFK
ncbi:MAG TPA: hypothetical protein DGR97_10465, partial [Gammaproteobacteria bacterium]|nr:hypothetical protein [Gammaproteobacteria bacterium]